MAINIVSKISAKCQNCPFFEVDTQTEEINSDCSNNPLFNVIIDCKHHDILCDGLEAMFTGDNDTQRPGMKKTRCAYCDKVFLFRS